MSNNLHIRDWTPDEYHARKFDKTKLPDLDACGPISASVLSKIRNPLEFLVKEDKQETKEMEWGSLVDCILTTPDRFNDYYILVPENAPARPTKAMIEAKSPSIESKEKISFWSSFDRQAAGKTPIEKKTLSEAQTAVSMFMRHKEAWEFIKNSRHQVVVEGTFKYWDKTDLKVKAMMDLLSVDKPVIGDIKTTFDMSDRGMRLTAFKFDYLLKMGWYCMLAEAAGLGIRDQAVLIWQNSSPPYEVKMRHYTRSEILFAINIIIPARLQTLRMLNPKNIESLLEQESKPMNVDNWMIEAYQSE